MLLSFVLNGKKILLYFYYLALKSGKKKGLPGDTPFALYAFTA